MKDLFSDIGLKVAQAMNSEKNENKMNPIIMLAFAWKECLDSRCRRRNLIDTSEPPDVNTQTEFPQAEMAVSCKSRVHPHEEDANFLNNVLYNFRQRI